MSHSHIIAHDVEKCLETKRDLDKYAVVPRSLLHLIHTSCYFPPRVTYFHA